MATYQSIRYNVDYQGNAGSLMPLLLFTSDGSDATASFTTKIDSTYGEYLFIINTIHSEDDSVVLTMNGSTDGGSNYNVTKQSNYFEAWHAEGDSPAAMGYSDGSDMAQGTGFLNLQDRYASDNDQAGAGLLWLFNPSSTTFAKHFLFNGNQAHPDDYTQENFTGGYFNTTSAINAIQFKMSCGEIQAGTIQMFGVI